MASCVKCGRHPLRKDRQKQFRCARCGPRQTYPPVDMRQLAAPACEAV